MQSVLVHSFHKVLLALLLTCLVSICFGQEKKPTTTTDTFFLAKKKGLLGKLGRSISINVPADTIGATINNVDPFLIYKDQKISTITITNITFGGSVNDTNKIRKTFFLRLADNFHVVTRERIIRNNLFFKVGDNFFPNLVADNERYLRDQSFIQDARIIVTPANADTSAININIVYKDVFSISGTGSASAKNAYLEVKDDNFMGQGQRIITQQYYDIDRTNRYGFGVEYTKRNIKGSFVDFTIGYNNVTPSFNSGRREETATYARLEMPLVSPYYLWTGALEASHRFTTNRYLLDSTFNVQFNYKYNLYDVWAGYNITNKTAKNEGTVRKVKQFIAIRATERKFTQTPTFYKDKYVYQYANLTSILAAYTIFKQEYYRTNFLYGFGRNEDIPEGFNYSLITGWTDRGDVARPYLGIDFQRNYFTGIKSYFNHTLKIGGYLNNKKIEDVGFLLSTETFTKLRKLGKSSWFTRHFLNASISQQYNRSLDEPIRLNSIYGIEQFNSDSATLADTRLSFGGTSVFYNTWKLSGFSFAPFAAANITFIKPIGKSIGRGDVYSSFGGGIRSRNENLVFGTMELKAFYFPRVTNTMNVWNITFVTDLRFRYNSQYIKRPDFVNMN
ncbi:MAG: hypothetical protein H7101_00675 [Deinococcales bacterium]|nr:hypothetical protein [Chitinophagaceae bacterium]